MDEQFTEVTAVDIE